MTTRFLLRTGLLAATLALATTAAMAEGDIYSRLAEMRAKMMKSEPQAMVTKREYMEYVSQAWDLKAHEMKAKDGKLTQAQLKELEAALSRMVTN
ncbi:hypothetical protein [Piscinibacter terrae]|uniref:Uncharacterized protein n=1 Tax=Piscinibacter terrae TaxID=2496871 RepID=A0A3N7HMX8_9BURK|nr:hypothetical protein [Albitalea terrae]RQP23538.1 hypothetical protein DZC73_15415 [Albitalea terrae]